MLEFDPEERTGRENSRIVKSAVTPRPIGWVSTVSEDGADNLAPFSSYNYITSSTPVLVFNSTYRDDGGHKDTVRNALDTEEFVVNVVTEPLAEQMDKTSAELPPEESEFDFADVERAESARIDVPRVADAVVSMECRLYDTNPVYDKLMIMGEVVYFHVAEEVMTDGRIDMLKIDTVARLGGPYYSGVEVHELQRNY